MELLYFKSNNCGACKKMLPTVEDICTDNNIDLHIINYEDNKEPFIKYHVQCIPTIIRVDDEEDQGRLIGMQTASKIVDFIGGNNDYT